MKTNPHSSIFLSLSLSDQLFTPPAIFDSIDVVNLTIIQVGVKGKKKNVRAETGKLFVFVQISNPH
jgi:hypothetical protein